ncbi:MAG: maleylpyruvate isomerase family mycothiol-dependent enzyme [Dermatophilaceae bacterium]
MNSPSHLSDNLVLLAHETSALMRTAATLDDETIRVASLCEGWTRAHVLSHIARNADALGNLVGWAVTGIPRAMYSSPDARDADITAGSTRGAKEILTDLEDSAVRFASLASGLDDASIRVEVEMRAGRKVLGGQLPTLRLMEVVFHHVDLSAGYTFAEADPGFVQRAISIAVERFQASAQAPPIRLRSDEGGSWSIGEGAPEVTGSNAALLLWLARGQESGVTSEAPLPALPSWG